MVHVRYEMEKISRVCFDGNNFKELSPKIANFKELKVHGSR